MHTARHLTPEEQHYANAVAAHGAAMQAGMPRMAAPAASYAMQPATALGSPPAPSSAAHSRIATAAQMMAAAAMARGRGAAANHHHAAAAANQQHQADHDMNAAFASSGRQDLLPYLAPRPNQTPSLGGATPNSAQHAAAAQQAVAQQNAVARYQQQQMQQRQAQQAKNQHASISDQELDDHAIHYSEDSGEPQCKVAVLVIPAIGAPLPSMRGMKLIDIPTPYMHPHDVLCGRGGGTNNHPGNEAFRDLVTAQKVLYLHSSKRDKPFVSRGIVRAVRNQHPPGRFMQKNESNGLWYDIGDHKAREKTSQALREGAPEIRREITNTLGAPRRQTLVPQLPFQYGTLPGMHNPRPQQMFDGAAAPHIPAHDGGHDFRYQILSAAGTPVSTHVAPPVAPQPAPAGMGAYAMRAMSQAPSAAHYERLRVTQTTMALSAQQQAAAHARMAPVAGAPNPQIPQHPGQQQYPGQQQHGQHHHPGTRAPVFTAAPQVAPPPARAPVAPTQVVPQSHSLGLARSRGTGVGVLGGGRLDPKPFGGASRGLPLGPVGRTTLLAPHQGQVAPPRPPVANAFNNNETSLASRAKPISRDSHRRAGAKKNGNHRNRSAASPLSHDCTRRLILAETIAQKTVNGTITEDMKAEEYRISLYMDAGLLNIDPKEIVRALARGETESDVVEKAYGKLCEKRKRDDLLPPCRKAPKTEGALAALGALTQRGIREALKAIGAAPLTAGLS